MNNKSQDSTPVIIDDVSRRFRRKQALDHVTLNVPQGVVFGLVGENGAVRRRWSNMSWVVGGPVRKGACL